MTTNLPSIAVLGAGSMGGAILSGLLAPEVTVDGGIRVTTRSAAAAAAIKGVTAVSTELDQEANRSAVAGARVVLLGVKPPMVADLLREIAPALEPDAIVVSLAVGVTVATMEALVPVSVLRSMPNTPALVGNGVTGIAAGSRTTDEELKIVTALFETVGVVLVVPEGKLDALSTISGSGPAYVFLLIEELTKTAIGLGFSEEEAATMVNGTFRGAAELLAASGSRPEELRKKVTSPKGTTERAISVLQDAGLSELFDRATAAALARATELAR
jgi:pyrroline-5-carboxylate reductase